MRGDENRVLWIRLLLLLTFPPPKTSSELHKVSRFMRAGYCSSVRFLGMRNFCDIRAEVTNCHATNTVVLKRTLQQCFIPRRLSLLTFFVLIIVYFFHEFVYSFSFVLDDFSSFFCTISVVFRAGGFCVCILSFGDIFMSIPFYSLLRFTAFKSQPSETFLGSLRTWNMIKKTSE